MEVEKVKISKKLRLAQLRRIYELLNRDPRITITDISKELGITQPTIRNRMNEAIDKGYMSMPKIRKKSFSNFKEYVYFVRCKDPLELYLQYSKDQRIIYHAVMGGFTNLWVISKEEIDIDGDILISGPRSDYHVPFAPNHTWKTGIKNIEEMTERFEPNKYEPKGVLQTHWDETIEWDAIDEILYRYFKYDLRKPLTPLKREYLITTRKYKDWFKKLPEYCTVYLRYFPKGISSYDSYIFVFETDYDDFIIDLFSQLPTSSTFFKVSNKLILYAFVERGSIRDGDIQPISDVSELHIPFLVKNLSRKGIVRNAEHTILSYHWGKRI